MADSSEKQRKRLQQILEVEQGRFTNLISSVFEDGQTVTTIQKEIDAEGHKYVANALEWCPEEYGALAADKNIPDRIRAAAESARNIAKAEQALEQSETLEQHQQQEESVILDPEKHDEEVKRQNALREIAEDTLRVLIAKREKGGQQIEGTALQIDDEIERQQKIADDARGKVDQMQQRQTDAQEQKIAARAAEIEAEMQARRERERDERGR